MDYKDQTYNTENNNEYLGISLFTSLREKGFNVSWRDYGIDITRKIIDPSFLDEEEMSCHLMVTDKGLKITNETPTVTISIDDGKIFILLEDNPEYTGIFNSELIGNEDRNSALAKTCMLYLRNILNNEGVEFKNWKMEEASRIQVYDGRVIVAQETILTLDTRVTDTDNKAVEIKYVLSTLEPKITTWEFNPNASTTEQIDIQNRILELLKNDGR